ncbi:hypothetical protein GCM10010331_20860 [Streptomyces xanthochromogenes]|nr:hypothetical protein GCM10010331_20860 [Streptomyces xanthochromogenes]
MPDGSAVVLSADASLGRAGAKDLLIEDVWRRGAAVCLDRLDTWRPAPWAPPLTVLPFREVVP